MEDIYNYINIYDELMNIIKTYQEKKSDNQILIISIINENGSIMVDIGIEDLENKNRDIKTKVFDIGFNEYVLPRLVIRYNSWYETKEEKTIENGTYINKSLMGDTLKLVNYSNDAINYIRCLMD